MSEELKAYLWVVEIKWEGSDIWELTTGAGITRADGRDELEGWRNRNPCDKFRLVKYRRAND